MNLQLEFHPPIPVVPAGVARPLWSVMIPTYNCARYLRETLLSVLQQDPGPEQMQIEVIDDHSTQDDPEAVVREVGNGRVGFYRQPVNRGIVRNFETSLLRSRGQLIHQLHGDDAVRPGFYQQMAAQFSAQPEIGMALCQHIIIDETSQPQDIVIAELGPRGVLANWLERIATAQQIQTPTVVVRRAVYECLGGFDRRQIWAEDWEMWVRIAAHYPVSYEPTPLALYRKHSGSSTLRCEFSGEHTRYACQSIGIFHDYLPADKADAICAAARRNVASRALGIGRQMLRARQFRLAGIQLRAAVRCDHSLPLWWCATRMYGGVGLYWLRRLAEKTGSLFHRPH